MKKPLRKFPTWNQPCLRLILIGFLRTIKLHKPILLVLITTISIIVHMNCHQCWCKYKCKCKNKDKCNNLHCHYQYTSTTTDCRYWCDDSGYYCYYAPTLAAALLLILQLPKIPFQSFPNIHLLPFPLLLLPPLLLLLLLLLPMPVQWPCL